MGVADFMSFTISNPPRATLAKARAALNRRSSARAARRLDSRHSTFPPFVASDSAPLRRYISRVPVELLQDRAHILAAEARALLEHRFDLLGSGLVCVARGMKCSGVEGVSFPPAPSAHPTPDGKWLSGVVNPANFSESARLWRMVSPAYNPIDWQLDFKSGFRWSERAWSPDVRSGNPRGADIKVPWELARMQHLPRLGFAFALAADGSPGFDSPDVYSREFQNVILDFTAANPPRYGANWACAMDVAIRASNMLLAFDIFSAAGARFDASFLREFSRAIRAHGSHIVANLEWRPDFRSNHYLSDIGGLLFVSAYLPCDAETDSWLAFAARELRDEFFLQFNPDGSNFEASTSYHRLSLEIVLFSAALALGLSEDKTAALCRSHIVERAAHPNPSVAPAEFCALPSGRPSPLPFYFFERVSQALNFAMDVTRPDGRIAQIGDNDSGRFFKLSPALRAANRSATASHSPSLEEDHLDHRHLAAAAAGLFSSEILTAFGEGHEIETGIICMMSCAPALPFEPPLALSNVGCSSALERALADARSAPPPQKNISTFESRRNLRDELSVAAYPDFGLYIFRSPELFLCARCGSVGQMGNGGHAHNDQLAVELVIDGKSIFADPGSYLYTPLPERRNEYRAAAAHAVPLVKEAAEPGRLDVGLFTLKDLARAECLYFSEKGFAGVHRGFGAPVFRCVEVLDHAVKITDYSPSLELLKTPPTPPPFSPGYGLIDRE